MSNTEANSLRAQIDAVSQEMNALSERLLKIAESIHGNNDALFAVDDARKCLGRGRHDLQRAKTRLLDQTRLFKNTESTQ
jgi:hypothetical protein